MATRRAAQAARRDVPRSGPGAVAAPAIGWAVAAAMVILVGCDVPVPPATTADGTVVKAVTVNPADPAEAAAAAELEDAQAAYDQGLKVLHVYYVRTGAYDQQRWAENEMQNLTQARLWRYQGIPAPAPRAPQAVEGASEAALVERVLGARQRWLAAGDALDAHYKAGGQGFKLALIRNVRQRFDPIRTYSYFLHAEVPPATLRPTEVIPAADELFDKALKLHRAGKPLPGVTDYPKQRRALAMFLELVRRYPTSTRIALAAYAVGDIYKEYFNENVRAVQWYQRAWEWDPKVMKPARFQAAVVYDLRLAQHGKALRPYQDVIRYEQFNQSNVTFAANRIMELTRPKE